MSFDTDVSEFTELDTQELHLVPAGANGFLPLLAKSEYEEPAEKACGIEGCEVCPDVEKAKLTADERNALPDSDFAIPETREYPIHNRSHAENALSRSSGKPEEKRVRAAVHKRYPNMGDASKAAPSQQATEAIEAAGCDEDEALVQTRAHPVDGAPVDRDTAAGPGHVPSVPASAHGSVDLHARHGQTAPNKTEPTGEAESQTRAVTAKGGKGKPVSMENPDAKGGDGDDDEDDVAKAFALLKAVVDAGPEFVHSAHARDAINRATTLIGGLVDGNNQTAANKEVSDMDTHELMKLLDERDAKKKELKKAKAERKAAKAAKKSQAPEGVEKGAEAPTSTTGTDESDAIKELRAEVEALKNQPAGHRPAINGLADTSVRAVRRGDTGNPFEALEKAVAEASTPRERRERQDELTKAKILANAHIHEQSRPGRPVPLISQPPEAYANALAAHGRR